MIKRPKAPDMAPVIYAIGDVHGEAQRLLQLHSYIFERHEQMHADRPLRMVHLGDYVDRGSNSADVIDIISGLENRQDISCINLLGNHEEMMLNGLTRATATAYDNWLINGGKATIESYKARGEDSVPKRHINWLKTLLPIHIEDTPKLIFVHAGINPSLFPNESDATYRWTRSPRFFNVSNWSNPDLDGWTVVHGHTPTDDFYPEHSSAKAARLNIDTGAVFGGRLTAAIFVPGEDVQFIFA
jgi:serine/threonine protein phosphatase 1